MNRVWEYDITSLVKEDAEDNVYQLKVLLHSPIRYAAMEDQNAQSEQLLMRCLAFRIFERLPACMDGIGVQDSQMPDCFDVFLSCR